MVTEESQKEWAEALQDVGAPVTPETYMKSGEIIGKDAEAGFALRVSDLAYKGYVKVWDTLTGRLALQPRWLLWQTFQKKRADGSTVFSTTDPHIPPNYGQDLKCYLHVDDPEWPKYEAMGFISCPKQHMPHQDGKDSHARNSHKRFWLAREADRHTREREEDRELQRETNRIMQEAILRNVQAPEVNTARTTDSNTVLISSNPTIYREDHVPVLVDRQPFKHTHLYRGKKAGAPCKVEGCEVVRQEAARTRTKK